MDDVDLAVRALVYAHFGRTGRALTRAELADQLARSPEWVDERLARLAGARALVLDAAGEIAKALPFCATPTNIAVRAGGVTYYGNCAWDAFALAALLGAPATIDIPCGDCGQPLDLDAPGALVHFAVPAARWWSDIFFT